MNQRRTLLDRLRIPLLVASAWAVLGLLNASRLRALLPHYEPEFGWSDALLWGLPDAFFWAVLSAIPIALARRFPVGRSTRVWLVHALGVAIVIVAHGFIDSSVSRLTGSFAGVSLLDATIDRVTEAFYANILVYALVVGITQYLASVAALREARQRATELAAELSQARLLALRMQIRPHFVMNALNTVAGLVESEPEAARTNLRRLGDLMRASTSAENEDEVPLSKELAFTRDYLEIEQARFRDRLKIRFEVEDGLEECLVPVFVLQPLAENSVVHGIAPKHDGGCVEIHAREEDGKLHFEVRDDGMGIPGHPPGRLDPERIPKAAGTGIGLQNVRRRLQSIYGPDHTFEMEAMHPSGLRVSVSIPKRNGTSASPSTAASRGDR